MNSQWNSQYNQSYFKSALKVFFQALIQNPSSNKYISLFAIWINFLQIIAFNYFQNEITIPKFNKMQWYDTYMVLPILARPSLFFKNIDLINQHDAVMFTLIGVFLLLILILLIVLVCLPKHPSISQKVLQSVMQFSCYFNWLFYTPCLDALSQIINTSQEKTNSQIYQVNTSNTVKNYSISYVLLIIIIMYSFISSKFAEQSFNLENQYLSRTNLSNIYIVSNQMKVLIVFLACVKNNFSQIIVNIVSLIYVVLMYYDNVKNLSFPNQKMINNFCLASAITFSFIIVLPFQQSFDLINNHQFFTFQLLLLPLMVKYVLVDLQTIMTSYIFNNQNFNKSSKKSFNKQTFKHIVYLISNKDYYITQKPIIIIGFYQQHVLHCKLPICFCQGNIIGGLDQSERNEIMMEYEIFYRYIRFLIRDIVEDEKLQNQEKLTRELFLQYMLFMSQQGRHTYAMQKIIERYQKNQTKTDNKSTQLFIQECMLNVTLNQVKVNMKQYYMRQIQDELTENTVSQIDYYVEQEVQKAQIIQKLILLIDNKVEMLEIMRAGFNNFSQVEKLNMQLNMKLVKLEKMIDKFYKQFPLKQNQNLYCFFESEIKGDMRIANSLLKSHEYTEALTTKIFRNQGLLNIFSNEIASLVLAIGRTTGKIINYSVNVPSLFGYKKQEFDYLAHMKDLMPVTIQQNHDDLIKFYLTTGQDNIIYKKRFFFAKLKSNLLIRIEGMLTMNLHYPEEIPFSFFCKVVKTESGFLIISSKGHIEGMNKEFLNKVNFYDVQDLPAYYKIDAQQIIPDFNEFIQVMNQQNLSILEKRDINFQFFKKNNPLGMSIFYANSSNRQYQSGSKQQEFLASSSKFSNKNQFTRYKADIIIMKRQPPTINNNFIYYIMELKSLSQPQNTQGSTVYDANQKSRCSRNSQTDQKLNINGFQSSSFNPFQDFKEGNQDDPPAGKKNGLEVQQAMHLSQIVNLNQEDKEDNENNRLLQNNQNNQNEINQFKANNDKRDIKRGEEEGIGREIGGGGEESNKHKQYEQQVSKVNNNAVQNNHKGRKRTNTKILKSLSSDNKTEKNDLGDVELNSKQKLEKKLQLYQMAMQDNDGQSVGSSLESKNKILEKFRFYKEFINSPIRPKSFYIVKIALFFEMLSLFLSTLLSIIILYNSFSTQSNRIENLKIKQMSLQPIGSFLILSQSAFNKLNQQSQQIKKPYDMMKQIVNQYEENLNSMLIKEEITQFYTENQFYVTLTQDPSQDSYLIYQFTIKSILEQAEIHMNHLLKYNENYNIENQFIWNTTNSMGTYFLEANFIKLYMFFDQISKKQLEEMSDYRVEIDQTLIIDLIGLNSWIAIIFCITLFNIKQFEDNIKTFLQLITITTIPACEKEIFRLKIMNQKIMNNQEFIFNFQFNIVLKEIELGEQHDESTQNNQKRKKMFVSVQNNKLTFYRIIIFILFSYSLFFIQSLIQYSWSDDYFSQLFPAFRFYHELIDVTLIPTVLMSLQTFFQNYQENKLFYNQQDYQNYSTLYNQKIQSLIEFQDLIQNINQNDFFSPDLKVLIDSKLNENICDLNKEQNYNCSLVKNGILSRGILNSITAFYSDLTIAKQVNYKDSRNQIENAILALEITKYSIQITDLIEKNFEDQRNFQIYQNLVLTIVYIIIVVVLYISEICMQIIRMEIRYQMVKCLIFTVPPYTSMIEDKLIKMIKMINNKIKIIQ